MSFCVGFEQSAMIKEAVRLPAVALAGMLAVSPASMSAGAGDLPKTDNVHEMIQMTAKRHKLDPHIFKGLVFTESSFRPRIINREGVANPNRWSIGLSQVQPRTAKDMGFRGHYSKLQDPGTNLEFGARYLKKQLKRYDGDYSKALSAYNAGTATGANKKYVSKIMQYAKKVKGK